MKIILITHPDYLEDEQSLINEMFEKGLCLLHLRKPGYDRESLSGYLDDIKRNFHSRIVIHSCYDLVHDYNLKGIHITGVNTGEKRSIISRFKKTEDISISISYHALEDLDGANTGIDYIFLSPVFDSISKKNYKARFDHAELARALKRSNVDVIALGGCREDNIKKIKELGFSGAAVLGAIWNSRDPVNSFLSINRCAAEC